MKRILLAGACAAVLAACGHMNPSAPAPAPEIGAWGFAVDDMKPAVLAGDDFFRYANGKWLDSFEIPADFSNYGAFTVLFERSEEHVKAIIEEAASGKSAAGSSEQKIGDYYATYLDTDRIETLGLEPARADLARLAALRTHEDVARVMAQPDIATNSPIAGFVNIDAKNTSRYLFYLTQAGLGLPDRDYYLDDKFADKRDAYTPFIEHMLSLAGIEHAAEKAKAVFALEKRIAKVHWDRAKRRDRDLTYNRMTREELIAYAPEFPWAVSFQAAGLDKEKEFVLREKDALRNSAKIFAETPVDTWVAYLQFNYLSNNADVLPKAFDDANFEFFGKTLRGQPEQRARWKRGVAAVNGALGEAIGKVYVKKYFPPESKTQMVQLVKNLRTAFAHRLDELDWMSEETKVEARKKLAKFIPKIGYPDKWKDYSTLNVVRGDAMGNARRANVWGWNDQIGKLGGPIDRYEWFMNPQTVNAYYSPTRNEVVFPAAILQAPFFDPAADPAVNYGAIGAVIGHEMGHGFDDQGRKSDGDGMLRDWWSKEDADRFQAKADRLGNQYAVYEPVPGSKLNPKLTMGENIGDLGGLSLAYAAYRLSLKGKPAPVIDGYTGDQRFFLAWAQVWKRKYREDELKRRVATDPHSPSEFRCNGIVRNMDAWYAAFDVKPGNALYLPPEERVTIW
ncbi:MAG: M13 family peptidase [Gammaproteobacteria bacterium]|nr:M13 family peptidase [Gammaproteobacteria bacterium]